MGDETSSLTNGAPTRAGEMIAAVGTNVRRLREELGWSLAELARRADVAKSSVSTVENGEGNPGLETLVAISVALGVPLSTLIAPHVSEVNVLRASEGPSIRSAEGSFRGRLVLATGRTAETEIFDFELDPGTPYVAEPHPTGVSEMVLCTAGRVRVGPEGAEVVLSAGDRATFAADKAHIYQALRNRSRVVLVLSYRKAPHV